MKRYSKCFHARKRNVWRAITSKFNSERFKDFHFSQHFSSLPNEPFLRLKSHQHACNFSNLQFFTSQKKVESYLAFILHFVCYYFATLEDLLHSSCIFPSGPDNLATVQFTFSSNCSTLKTPMLCTMVVNDDFELISTMYRI